MPTQSNLKKVLRTALVGIKPADQVMIKGYLRVLLRLEADLEWVSANHPQVDLFMINNEFREAASVTKLLSSQSQKPVLYISRTDIDEGWIKQDRLILPLKKLDELNDWLMASVLSLKQGAGIVTNILQQNDPQLSTLPSNAALTKAPKEPAAKSAADNNTVSTALKTPEINLNSNLIHPQSTSLQRDYGNVIEMMQQLKTKPEGLYQLCANNQPSGSAFAIIAPKEGRVWCQSPPSADLALTSWQLTPYQGGMPNPAQAYDLTQWLWQQAWLQSEPLLALINDHESYQLSHWIKPELRDYAANMTERNAQELSKKERQALLTIMTALEAAPKTINELSAAAQISIKASKRIVLSLLFSGSLQQSSYAKLERQRLNTAAQAATAEPDSKLDVTKISEIAAAHVQLERSDSDIENPPQTSDNLVTSPPNQSPENAAMQQQKMGFLSKLRHKLGL
ncbi:hypothetical protein [Psychrobacter ciconiae]|uniref:hypothetical protein n=1 Tax=Psychrobacter ciconiae TaxID=1553449 RepID=UPI001919D10B|nr:hypothetical protein [Psychrobacter ciconiae]